VADEAVRKRQVVLNRLEELRRQEEERKRQEELRKLEEARKRKEELKKQEELRRLEEERKKKGVHTNSLGMTFRLIPSGTFMMGSPPNEPGRSDDETLHKVTLTKGFYMQTTQVTQKQWQAVMGNNPSHFKNDENCPVEQVSWDDVQEFIRKLNEKEGTDKYRLPSEAEWEYACRAGTITPFYFGKCLSTDQANYDGNYPLEGCPNGIFREKTVPVGSFPANAWGLYDMHGNVWEWVADIYSNEGVYIGEQTDPIYTGSGSRRVNRGGSWRSSAQLCRSARRLSNSPVSRGNDLGFRLAGK